MDFYFFTLRKAGPAKTGTARSFPPALYRYICKCDVKFEQAKLNLKIAT